MNILTEIKRDLSKNKLYLKSAFKKCPKCNSWSVTPIFHHINNKNMWEAEYYCVYCNEVVGRSWE